MTRRALFTLSPRERAGVKAGARAGYTMHHTTATEKTR